MLQLKGQFEKVMEGVQARRLKNGFAHLRIHYLADPLKRGDWADRAAVFYGGKESPLGAGKWK
jgi:AAA+ superfamily predicted ATPase